MKNLKLTAGLLALVLAGTMTLSSCGGNSNAAGSAGGDNENNGGEKVKLTFACTWVEEEMRDQTYPLDIVNKYAQDNNIELSIDPYNSSDYQNTVFKTMAAAKNLPEIFLINSMDMKSSVKGGLLYDLTSYLDEDTAWADSFLPGLFVETTFDDKIYGVPYQFITNECVYFNKNILSELGYETVPAEWAEFLELCEKAKNAGYIPIALGDKDGWPLYSNLAEILCEYLCGPEWVAAIGGYTDQASYDDPKFISVLTTIKDLNDKGYFNEDMVSIDNNTQDKAYFYNEKAAMILGGSYTLTGLVTDCPEELIPSLGVAPTPRPAGAIDSVKAGIFTGGSGWEVAVNAENTQKQADAAVGIAKAMTGQEYARNDVEVGRIPVIKMENVGEYDASKIPVLQDDMNKLISQAPSMTLMNQQQSGAAMSEILYKKLQEIIIGQTTPEQAAKDIQAVYEEECKTMQ
ncbi:ABC transporter substrate-binding protein [Massiliimalia massiliensis]|uniref:ABC transporter substrate-binding protein n=1 Tax=Massiliimalia massiliensis TaxID=1852384 RepID=UPI000987906A|nr:extracellular solute-binding protein [Massiliimalia massiliensis]